MFFQEILPKNWQCGTRSLAFDQRWSIFRWLPPASSSTLPPFKSCSSTSSGSPIITLKMKLLKWKVERLRCERIETFTINIQIIQKLFIFKFCRWNKKFENETIGMESWVFLIWKESTLPPFKSWLSLVPTKLWKWKFYS